jgi:hypothetical protein
MKNCLRCNNKHDGLFGTGKYCNRSCANTRIHSKETKDKIAKALSDVVPSNKGSRDGWVKSKCLHCGEDIKHYKSTPRKYHHNCWRKVSGGLREGSGKGKSGWYKGIWCDSSYELAWVIYQIEHNLPFKRNKRSFTYTWKGKERKYYPDFIQNEKIIEIKGFVNEQTLTKFKAIDGLIVLYKNDLEKEISYVVSKYGTDYITLYDGNPHNKRKNKCKVCNEPAKKDYCTRVCSGIGNNRNSKLI